MTPSTENPVSIEKYFRLRDAGATANDVCSQLFMDRVGLSSKIQILRDVFDFSLRQAMNVIALYIEEQKRQAIE